MGRRTRIEIGRHHVTNRGADREVVFRDDRDRIDFGRRIAEASDRFGVGVIAYCSMPNHYHLVLDCPDGGLSGFPTHKAEQLARWRARRSAREDPVLNDVLRRAVDLAAVDFTLWTSRGV